MSKKVYNLVFKGYWRDINRDKLPSVPGIYIVYRCTYSKMFNTVNLLEIIYIGQTENVHKRHNDHNKRGEFLNKCQHDETLCYSVAEVNNSDLDIIENALIFTQKPSLNTSNTDHFNYPPSEFHLEGCCALMSHTDFTIQ